MANMFWVDHKVMAGADPKKFSGPSSGLCLQSEDLNITSQINVRSKKRSFDDENDRNAAKAAEECLVEGSSMVTPKRRGRPKGSVRKSRAPPISEIDETLNTLKNCVFQIPSGDDVRIRLETFALRHRLGLCILSGSGTVTHVTLLQPAAPGGVVTYPGPLGILSLSGVFHPAVGPIRMTVILQDGRGVTVGGRVVGRLVASDLITVVTAVASDIPYQRLNVNPLGIQPPGPFKSSVLSVAQQQEQGGKIDDY